MSSTSEPHSRELQETGRKGPGHWPWQRVLLIGCLGIIASGIGVFLSWKYFPQPQENSLISTATASATLPPTPDRGPQILYLDSGGCVVKAIGPDGSDPITITTLPPPFNCWRPKFSPNGRMLAFVSMDGNYDLYVMNLDGSGLRMVADAMAFAWSPDSTQLVYQTKMERGGLSLVNADGSDAHPLGYTDLSICTVCDGDIDLSWSPDGQWIYAPADLNFPESYEITASIFKADGTEHRELNLDDVSIFTAAAWSPDSKSLALPAYDTDGESCAGLDIFDLLGSHKEISAEIAHKLGEPGMAPSCFWSDFRWSPDGEMILVFGYPQGHFASGEVKYDRILVASSNGEHVNLLEYWPGHPRASLWSPDGSQIVFIASPDMDSAGRDGPLVIMSADPNSPQYEILANMAKNDPGALYWLDD